MAKLPVYPGKSSSTNQNTTNYGTLMGGEQFTTAISETAAQRTLRTIGVFSNLLFRIPVGGNNNTANPSASFVFRKNTATGTQAISCGASATGEFEDTSGTDTGASGDLINFREVTGVDATKVTTTTISGCAFSATTNTVICHGTTTGTTPTTASTTFFIKYCGSSVPAWTNPETATQQFKFKVAGTIKNANMYVNSNGRGSTTTFAFSVGGVAGNIAKSILTTQTGQFEDTTNTEVVASGTLVSRSCANGTGTGAGLAMNFYNDFSTTDSTSQYLSTPASQVYNASTTTFEPFMGKNLAATTETDAQMKMAVATDVSLYEVYVAASTIATNSTIRPRKNAANIIGAISVGSLATGWIEDPSGLDSFISTDEGNWSIAPGAIGTSFTIEHLAVKAEFTGGAFGRRTHAGIGTRAGSRKAA